MNKLPSASRSLYLRCTNNYKIVIVSLGPNHKRMFSSWALSEPITSPLDFTDCTLKISFGESPAILRSPSFQHWFKNWQELRKHKLTASTFAGAIGFWPRRRVQLWLEKLGAIEPFAGNFATCWSNIKEEEALERYKLITASPDGMVENLVYGSSQGVLEIKCPYFGGDMTKAAPYSRIPLYYIPQLQGLMEISDRDWMDFYVWTANGSSLFRVYRDVNYWNVIKIALSDFWWDHVQPAREVCLNSTITNPLIELKEFRPAPRHELCSFIVCESKRIVDESKLLMREINGRLMD